MNITVSQEMHAQVQPGYKICADCGQLLALDNYHHNARASDLRVSTCRECLRRQRAARNARSKMPEHEPVVCQPSVYEATTTRTRWSIWVCAGTRRRKLPVPRALSVFSQEASASASAPPYTPLPVPASNVLSSFQITPLLRHCAGNTSIGYAALLPSILSRRHVMDASVPPVYYVGRDKFG